MPGKARSKKMSWISLKVKKPQACLDILFTNGKYVYKGWLESYHPGEDLIFVNDANLRTEDNVTHWMILPEPPRKDDE